jgi:biopolymer transport protein ExbD
MSFASQDDDGLMSEINMTPLVDVMLVLLIIFIITIPVIQHAVRVELPHASSQREDARPQRVSVAIDAAGQLYWNATPVDDQMLAANVAAAAAQQPQPELRLQADRNVRYERVAEVMSAARRAGLARIGFVTEPAR